MYKHVILNRCTLVYTTVGVSAYGTYEMPHSVMCVVDESVHMSNHVKRSVRTDANLRCL
jgi:hypothetical protein